METRDPLLRKLCSVSFVIVFKCVAGNYYVHIYTLARSAFVNKVEAAYRNIMQVFHIPLMSCVIDCY